ncbi:MAG: hypothetical protein FJW27_12555 [Acidimicrobiia bacterium]|nr:hypothetical protein [Acidimicrobiia bacterium]
MPRTQLRGGLRHESSADAALARPATHHTDRDRLQTARVPARRHAHQFQRHKLRAWTTYWLSLGRFGALDSGLVYRYNSAQTYSLAGTGQGLSAIELARNPGYVNAAGSATPVFFDERGTEFFNASHQLDLSFLYQVPVWSTLRPWLKLELYNMLNSHPLIGFNNAVNVDPASSLDANGLRTGYIRPQNFGTARANNDYPRATTTPGGAAQYARTFLMSFGVRF